MVMESRSRPATLPLAQTFSQTLVTKFLDSIGRNSRQSKRIYGFGLSHFQCFLYNEYGTDCSIDSIIDSLTTNKINVYTFLDSFVSYLRGKYIVTRNYIVTRYNSIKIIGNDKEEQMPAVHNSSVLGKYGQP